MIREIEDNGFPVVNEMEDFASIGLDDTVDFYNVNHTNIHGALKITDYLAQYLIETYDFTDKRSDPDYDEWNQVYDAYKDFAKPYLTEEEWKQLP